MLADNWIHPLPVMMWPLTAAAAADGQQMRESMLVNIALLTCSLDRFNNRSSDGQPIGM